MKSVSHTASHPRKKRKSSHPPQISDESPTPKSMISPIRSLNVRSTAFPRLANQMYVSQKGPAFACTTVDPCFRMTSRRHLAACARVRTTHDVDGSSSTWRFTHSSSASSHPGTVHSAVVVEFVSVVGRHRFIAEKVSMSTSHSSARASGLSIGAATP